MSAVPVYINGSVALSALAEEQLTAATFHHAEVMKKNPQFDCLYGQCAAFPLEESYQRIYALLACALDKLLINLSLSAAELKDTCLFLGSSSMDIGAVEPDENSAIWLNKLDQINHTLIKQYQLNSLHYAFSTACTSSANALIYSSRLLKAGKIKRALVVGCEFYNPLTLKGFSSLELLSQQGLKAFSVERDGLVLGEGVGALLLSCQQGASDQLALLGEYSACDTYSLTTTQEDGSHIRGVIEQALVQAQLTAKQVQLIKVHGTASPMSDYAEAQAIKSVFDITPPILALKPFIGHTLGACGVLEIALLADLIAQDVMPVPTYVTAEQQQNKAALLPFVSENTSFAHIEHILINHCGFGGNNAALVVKNLSFKNLSANSSTRGDLNTAVAIGNNVSQVNGKILASYQLSVDSSLSTKALRKQVKTLTGYEVRRMDSFTLIAMQALYHLFHHQDLEKIDFTAKILGLYGVGEYFSVELLQSLLLTLKSGDDIRPVDFIASVGNSANFYLAKQFNINGPNLFLGARENGLAQAKSLAEIDLSLGLIDYAVLVQWQKNEHNQQCQVCLLAKHERKVSA